MDFYFRQLVSLHYLEDFCFLIYYKLMKDSATHYFGHQPVSPQQKTDRVQFVFDKTAHHYDMMNDLMSLGLHHCWKSQALNDLNLYSGDQVLDLAAGSCDLSAQILNQYPSSIHVTAADPNYSMLSSGRDKLIDAGLYRNINFCLCFAENLPFPTDTFALTTIGFGFRNFTDQSQALTQCFRTLKPGGTLIILEFSQPATPLMSFGFSIYSQTIIPALSSLIAKDSKSYQYLIESIEKQPPPFVVKQMLIDTGFVDVQFQSLMGGLVNIFKSCKPLG